MFIDIETVSRYEFFEQADERLKKLFEKKFRKEIELAKEYKEKDPVQFCWENNAALHAEFNKIIVICVGAMGADNNFGVKVLASEIESDLLWSFEKILDKFPSHKLCAHNGKGFDFPVLAKKFIMEGFKLPSQLNVMGKKPWETPFIDTMEMWSFGAFGQKTSLDLLSASLGVPSPKEILHDMSVHEIYYANEDKKQEALKLLGEYCTGDVVTLFKVYRKMMGDYSDIDRVVVK
ncbi:MAG TPA: ribonuclease H-like domain-containing protein [Smithella sp.]|nr:ribonuclease H-like domain-containing protein [Smithella sp.]